MIAIRPGLWRSYLHSTSPSMLSNKQSLPTLYCILLRNPDLFLLASKSPSFKGMDIMDLAAGKMQLITWESTSRQQATLEHACSLNSSACFHVEASFSASLSASVIRHWILSANREALRIQTQMQRCREVANSCHSLPGSLQYPQFAHRW